MELKEISRKIESVNNIWRITSALETLSALKMKKSQKITLSSRPFAEKITGILNRLDFSLGADEDSVFFEKREGKSSKNPKENRQTTSTHYTYSACVSHVKPMW